MPRVTGPSSAAAAAKAQPRAFAIYKQLVTDDKGEVDAKVLEEYARLYGSGAPSSTAKDLSYDEFAALFTRPTSHADVSGEGNCIGYAATSATSGIAPFRFTRRAPGPHDVQIQITHAGICHSDLHQVKNEWQNATYPMVPGHEIVGIVTDVGSDVKTFKVGDRAGVGCMVNSCQSCNACVEMKEEQFCPKCVFTYNGMEHDGVTPTQGGYSAFVVVNDKFVLRVPDSLPLEKASPLLCAGITTYSPIRHFGLDKPGTKLGVAGLGGLGHMAVKIAAAMGCEVTVLSTSISKKEEALSLGAKHFVVTKNKEEMDAAAGTLHGIINTIAAQHELAPYLNLLRVDGKMVCVGVPDAPLALPMMGVIFKRAMVAGSLIGGIKETQEMLDFCAEHNVTPCVEVIKADYINTAYERMVKSDVRYRFVIDINASISL